MAAPWLAPAAAALRGAQALVFTAGAGMGVDSGLPDFRGPQGFWKAYPPMQKLARATPPPAAAAASPRRTHNSSAPTTPARRAPQGLSFSDCSNPRSFSKDPRFGWGFFGHRYQLYTAATPHAGYSIMRAWAASAARGHFVFTSNVDGAFLKAGFEEDRVVECHGARWRHHTRAACPPHPRFAAAAGAQAPSTSCRRSTPAARAPSGRPRRSYPR